MNDSNGVEADQSASLGALAAALAKAQGAIKTAAKDSVNPHFKSKYADLASVREACQEALAANGIAVVQAPSSAQGGVCITTTLLHSSGEWMRSRCIFPVSQNSAQGYGSAITYGRRYSLAAMVGVAPDEDDDGNAATATPPPQAERPNGTRTAQLKEKLAAKTTPVDEPPPPSDEDAPYVPPDEPAQPKSNGSAATVPYGKSKGKKLSEVTDKDLSWLLMTSAENVAKHDRQWHQKNVDWHQAVQAEVDRRRKQ